jgi:hypothetical protein
MVLSRAGRILKAAARIAAGVGFLVGLYVAYGVGAGYFYQYGLSFRAPLNLLAMFLIAAASVAMMVWAAKGAVRGS